MGKLKKKQLELRDKLISDCHEVPVFLNYDRELPASFVDWHCTACGCQCKAIVITDEDAYNEQCDEHYDISTAKMLELWGLSDATYRRIQRLGKLGSSR